jgi:PAS domain S-box-containing protein
MEEPIDEMARRRHLVFETAYEGIWFVDRDARTTYVNPRMADMLGVTRDEMMGRHFYDFAHADDRPSLLLHFNQRKRGLRGRYDFRYVHQDGSTVWAMISSSPLFDERGEFDGVLAMHTDITDHKRTHERLYSLAAIVESSGDAIASLTLDGHFVTFNGAAERMSGYSSEEVCGRSLASCFLPEREEELAALVRRVLEGETVEGHEMVFHRKDGARIEVSLTLAPVGDAGGMVSRMVLSCRDVTERKREQEALRQAQKMEAVYRLAGGVAHDFNNMLAVIIGQLALVERQEGLTDRVTASMRSIRAAAEQSQNIVRQLLALSQKQVAAPREVDLNPLLEGLREMLAHSLGMEVEFELDLAPSLPPLWVDPQLMQQIVLNLAFNARDAMPEGGRLTLATRAEGRSVLLIVRDTGTGIPAEALPHIFEPFFTTKPFGKGTGLGLATTDGIVRQMGGEIQVASTVGRGTTFTVRLPVPDESGSSGERRCEGDETILLVDDEPLVRSTTRQMLTTCGYRVIEAVGPEDALRLADEHDGAIDLVLTDVRMPGMDGATLVDRLLEGHPALGVVYMSAFSDDARVSRRVRDGRAAFLQKPFSVEAVAWKVREVLDG